LTAALIGFGMALLKRKPALAGLCLGLLAYKPQFGVLIPLALVAGGHARAFAAAALTVALMAILTTALYGVEVWQAFADSWGFTRQVV
ncbi:glycosyltransferase 87 family protein, partial [Klebsiella pneumoniae]|uniref:glycosyltransferase 87 family protein n=1 Tax=Klebsiella pneumoniae TaxID=573 RepID=UPI003012C323